MLNIDAITPHLIRCHLVDLRSVLDGRLTITSTLRRNYNLRVTRKDGIGYLIKQSDDAVAGGRQTLLREAAFYSYCHAEPGARSVRALLPRLCHFDPERSLLALELLEGVRPLWIQHHADDLESTSVAASWSVGHALAVVHRAFRLPGPDQNPRLRWLRSEPPWVLAVHRPELDLLGDLSPAGHKTIEILQQQEALCAALDRLREQWSPETVIHGDVKSDNILVLPAPYGAAAGPPEVRLVDWELVQLGDPAWDVGSALHDLVLFWISTMPAPPPDAPGRSAAAAGAPLAKIQSAARAVWQGYHAGASLPESEACALLDRAARLSAARLIQSACEMVQRSHALLPMSVLLLQIGKNLLDHPEAGAACLYGLSWESS
ncbi:phosphotransferase [Sorangium sp. So ce426]|uniref:phosphotransferase n=1 Tax=Sorangium sp. So ce426 TaxID=3133312 RepID=UPI003F5C2DEA